MSISKKRSEASRKNGGKTEGPNNTERTRLNALVAGGLFAKTLVIKELGERQEEFDALNRSLNAHFAPTDPVQEKLVNDLVESWWLKDRVSRAETAEIRRSLLEINFGEDTSLEATLSSLKNNFELLFITQQSNSSRVKSQKQDPKAIESELTAVRARLENRSRGLAFLKDKILSVSTEIMTKGALSDLSLRLLQCCLGPSDERFRYLLAANNVIRAKKTKQATDRKARADAVSSGGGEPKAKGAAPGKQEEQPGEDEGRIILDSLIKDSARAIEMRRQRALAKEMEDRRPASQGGGVVGLGYSTTRVAGGDRPGPKILSSVGCAPNA